MLTFPNFTSQLMSTTQYYQNIKINYFLQESIIQAYIIYIYIYNISISIYIYTYIYIQRERDAKVAMAFLFPFSHFLFKRF